MAQETNQSQAPLLCTTGCGFYGNPRNNGMCSMCYKDFLQRQNSSGRVSPPASSAATGSLGESLLAARRSESSTVDVPSGAESGSASVSSPALLTPASVRSAEERPAAEKDGLKTDVPASSSVSAEGSVEGQDTPAEDTPSDKPNAKKNRCFTCRKKVGLTGFDCRCGRVFCGVHRYSDVHRCTFDYKADAAEKIRKENPVIVGEKIQKI